MTERQGRRRKKLLVDLKEKRRYWNSKELCSRSHCVEKWLRKTGCRMHGLDSGGRFLYQVPLKAVEKCVY